MAEINDVDRISPVDSGQDDHAVVYRQENATNKNSPAKSDRSPSEAPGRTLLYDVTQEVVKLNRKCKEDKKEAHTRLYYLLLGTGILRNRGTY